MKTGNGHTTTGVDNESLFTPRQSTAPLVNPLPYLAPPPGGGTSIAEEVLKALPVAVYTTDAHGRITFFNEAAASLWGVRPELGKSEFCGSWKLYRPDGTPLPHEECPMAIALRDRLPARGYEAVAERPDGTRVPFVPYPTPLFDSSGSCVGAVNVLVDITALKASQRRSQESDTKFRAVFENVGTAVFEQDFSRVSAMLGGLRAQGVKDLRAYLQAHPGCLHDAITQVRIIDANPFAVELFEAGKKEELLRSLSTMFLPETAGSSLRSW